TISSRNNKILTVAFDVGGSEPFRDELNVDWKREARSDQLAPAPIVVIVVVSPSTAVRINFVKGIATARPQPQMAMFRTVAIAMDGRSSAMQMPSDINP